MDVNWCGWLQLQGLSGQEAPTNLSACPRTSMHAYMHAWRVKCLHLHVHAMFLGVPGLRGCCTLTDKKSRALNSTYQFETQHGWTYTSLKLHLLPNHSVLIGTAD